MSLSFEVRSAGMALQIPHASVGHKRSPSKRRRKCLPDFVSMVTHRNFPSDGRKRRHSGARLWRASMRNLSTAGLDLSARIGYGGVRGLIVVLVLPPEILCAVESEREMYYIKRPSTTEEGYSQPIKIMELPSLLCTIDR